MEKGEKEDPQPVPFLGSTRLWLAIWGFLGCTFIYMLRFSFSVAIVCMTIEDNDTDTRSYLAQEDWHEDPIRQYVLSWVAPNSDDDDCDGEIGGDQDETGEFDWNRQLRGMMSSSFFWGYVLTQIPGGWLSQKIGGKRVLFGGILLAAVTSILSAPFARLSPYGLIVMRFINGLGQGVFFPSFYSMVGSWAPQNERAMMDAIFLSGAAMGSMFSFALSGVICADLGWQWIFYIYGVITLLWCIAWWFAVYDTPALHPRISQKERDYLEAVLGTHNTATTERPPVPWRGLLTSFIWAIVINDFCINWATYTGLTSLPQYMEDVLKFDIKSNGLYSALPQLAKFIMSFVFAFIGDWVLTRKLIKVTLLRKIMHTFATLVPMCFVIAVGFLDCNQAVVAIVFLTLQEAFNAAIRTGSSVTRIDMAPRFSGVVMGICNTSGNMAGIVSPIVVSTITSEGTRAQWQTCFYLSGAAYLIAWLVFTIFTNSEEQEWAKVAEEPIELDVKFDTTASKETTQSDDTTASNGDVAAAATAKQQQATTKGYRNDAFDADHENSTRL